MRLVLLRDLHFICIFIDEIKSELLTFIFQSDIVRIWAHIELSPLSSSVCQNVQEMRDGSFFYKKLCKE